MTSTYGIRCSNPTCDSIDTTDIEGADFPLCENCQGVYAWGHLNTLVSLGRFETACDLSHYRCGYDDDTSHATYYPQWQLQLCDRHHRQMISTVNLLDLDIQAFEQGQLNLSDL
ncbi:hypothetical protein [Nocardia arthritidis]|uniref:Uncharacterized protein n=1 Tax=Nocardia arthritidis TaxID=228602 RepID=A0A6G9Y7R1_9NOCA|nr:hypothetical protein [Nocardia arthritidis]QIS09295.1 hypothetical protein F5544_06925 [Nocardia arthritidis]